MAPRGCVSKAEGSGKDGKIGTTSNRKVNETVVF
jgi:hypothetical protein